MHPSRLCAIAILAVAASAASAQDPAHRFATIAPLLDDQTIAVGRLDLQKLDVPALSKLLGEIAPDKSLQVVEQMRQIETKGGQLLEQLTQAGISEIYAVISLADIPNPPFLVAPVKAGKSPDDAVKALREITQLTVGKRDGLVIAGSLDTLQRLHKLRPAAQPELASGFALGGDAAVQFVVAPSGDVRRVLREMLPRLPDEIGGGSGKLLADVRWMVLSASAPPKLSLNLTIQARDPDSASALRGLVVSGLQLAAKQEQLRKDVPNIDELARLLTPQIKGDRLTVDLTSENGGAVQAIALLARPLQAARTAAGRAQSTNNLKQLMLAMHNYHDVHNTFSPQAIRSKEGKPLLSWRVAMLPFIGGQQLYKEFRLDEPWDSDHNKALIAKMPPVLASPHLGDELRTKGMTSYLAPLSKQPPAVFVPPRLLNQAEIDGKPAPDEVAGGPQMVFDVPRGPRMALITDGTSNTIGIVEVLPKHAVIWTKPDDLVIDAQDPAAQLRGQPADGFNAAMCDGSVRFIKANLDPKMLLRLFQMDDGQAVGEF